MGTHESLETALLEAYRVLRKENLPEWAVHKRNSDEIVRATIPFVGKYYTEQRHKILIYASAENLTDYLREDRRAWKGDLLDSDQWAENRHRRSFEEGKTDSFFPNVHIGPMNDGRLATAVFYIATKLYQLDFSTPREFYETIAFANYGKFSIETERQKRERLGQDKGGDKMNIDYAGNRELLAVSHGYLQADMELLKPDCIIMPKTMYEVDREFIDRYKGAAVIVPIYQMNARVINCHIAKRNERYEKTALTLTVRQWYDKLMTNDNFLSVFSYLDDVLEHKVH